MFEYALIDGINDSNRDARELARLMKKPLYLVNLIPCNPVPGFSPSSDDRIKKFKEILEMEGVEATLRHHFGQDIDAACGQLAAKGN